VVPTEKRLANPHHREFSVKEMHRMGRKIFDVDPRRHVIPISSHADTRRNQLAEAASNGRRMKHLAVDDTG
jgi:hypothetical protein